MGHYVYRYVHPDYPWLYVGKTDVDLRKRIQTHDTSASDNINRKYLDLLLSSAVYYIELNSAQQSDYVERFLIDKYKPYLNIKDKNDIVCDLDVVLPAWKKLVRPCDLTPENFIDCLDRNNVIQKQNELNKLKVIYDKLTQQIEQTQADIDSIRLVEKPYNLVMREKEDQWYIDTTQKYRIYMDRYFHTWDKFEFIDTNVVVRNVFIVSKKHPEYDFTKVDIDHCKKWLDTINSVLEDKTIMWSKC